jgi:alpha-tubulin suppressor-like RCC1 family protein
VAVIVESSSRPLVAIAFAAALAGCAADTALMVVIDTDPAPNPVDRIVLTVTDSDGGLARDYPIDPTRRDRATSALTFALRGSSGNTRVVVRAVAFAGPEVAARASVQTRFVAGSTRMIRVPLCSATCSAGCDRIDDAPPLWTGVAPSSLCGTGSDAGDAAIDAPVDAMIDATIDDGAPDVAVTSPSDIVELATGAKVSCGIQRDGGMRCWGSNRDGQLGIGTVSTSPEWVATPSQVLTTHVFRQAMGGADFTCGVATNVTVYCTGGNADGELGIGGFSGTSTLQRVALPTGERAIEVATGDRHGCALADSGLVHCWGDNSTGALGQGSVADPSIPHTVPGLASVAHIAAGAGYSCALITDGTVRCWGSNSDGQLGRGTTGGSSPTPMMVSGLTSVREIAARGSHVCALTNTNEVYCWGANAHGECGAGSFTALSMPARATLPSVATTARQIAAGAAFSCVRTDTDVYCFGDDANGQLGIGATSGMTNTAATPVSAPSGLRYLEIACGDVHACARRSDGVVVCWGQNDTAQVGGMGAIGMQPTPVAVPGLVAATP